MSFFRHLKSGATWAVLPTLAGWGVVLWNGGSAYSALQLLMLFFAIHLTGGFLLSYAQSRGWFNRRSPG